jgi:hypothetical protein
MEITGGWSKNIGMDGDTYRVGQKHVDKEGMLISTGWSKNRKG